MKSMKKILAGVLSLAMIASLAACGGNSTPESTTAAATTAAATTAAATTAAATDAAPAADEPADITFSWWGGDARHAATEEAVNAFMAKYPHIKVTTQYAAWTGWEDIMATQFYAGTAPDGNQVNWNWLTSYSSDGSVFADVNQYADIFDLSQYDQKALDQCTVAGKLQAIPVSMTGRIFYWNKAAFDKAGIAVPTSLADLMAAGEAFKAVSDTSYPLVMGEYDRTVLLVYYLESIYNKPWVVDNKLNYTVEEIAEGLQFFSDLEAAHVIPTIKQLDGDGADSLDKNPKWIDGSYGGIFEWDSSATKFSAALSEGQDFIVGDYFKDFGPAQGGFTKVSLGFAISESSPSKAAVAQLFQFLLNEDEGTTIMASERGIPLSKAALANCQAQDKLNPLVTEANQKVLAWTSFGLDPKFEAASLKNDPDGVYFDVFSGLSYGEYDVQEAAQVMFDGITKELNS